MRIKRKGCRSMNQMKFLSVLEKPPGNIILIYLATAIILLLNAFGLIHGVTTIIPHLFYIPIILAAYYYPRRGIWFALVISAIYYVMALTLSEVNQVPEALGRIFLFMLIAAVVSFLTQRMRQSEEKYRMLADYTYDWEY